MKNSKTKLITCIVIAFVAIAILGTTIYVGASKKNQEVPEIKEVSTVDVDSISEEIAKVSEVASDVASSVVSDVDVKHSEDESTIETSEEVVISNESASEEVVDANIENQEAEVVTISTETANNTQPATDSSMVEGVDYSEWTQRQTWTASNGVTLKIKDGVDLNASIMSPEFVIIDGDIHPDSPYTKALQEFVGEIYLDETPSELPVINNSSVKRTSFPNTDPVFLDYQNKVNQTLKAMPATGGLLLSSDGLSTGVNDGIKNYWEFYYSGSYWTVKIYRNMPVVAWNCLRDCLKFVSPDGQLLYDVLYTDFFEGSDYIEDYDMWCPVGSSEIYQIDPSTYNVAMYYFR